MDVMKLVKSSRGHFLKFGLSLLVLCAVGLPPLLAAPRTQARQYNWTNFAGLPGKPGTADGTGSAALFMNPYGITIDASGKIYLFDALGNNTLRTITPDGVVNTIAGTPGVYGSADGTGPNAQFNQPSAVAADGSGNFYIVDSANQTIRKATPDGAVTTIAGMPRAGGTSNGTGSAALFHFPNGGAADGNGNLYVADSFNSTIRKVTPAGVVTTVAGSPLVRGTTDGTAAEALFSGPYGVAVDGGGNLFVADTGNNTIRKISTAGEVTTLAGSPGVSGTSDGAGNAAQFNFPIGIALDRAGNIYVADNRNHAVRKVTPSGVVTTIGGSANAPGTQDGLGSAAGFSGPLGVAVSSDGAVYVTDGPNRRVMKGVPVNGPAEISNSPEPARKATLNIGDIVMLKSGGPKMTVVAVGGEGDNGCDPGNLRCEWFTDSKTQSEDFPINALQILKDL